MDKEKLANLIDAFLDGTCGEWEWDDFTSVKQVNPELEDARQKCLGVRKDFPSGDPHIYCNMGGVKVLRDLVAELRRK